MSEHALDHRDAVHQQHHDQRKVGTRQARQVAEEHRNTPRQRELFPALGSDGEPDADPEADTGEYRGGVDDSRPRGWPGP